MLTTTERLRTLHAEACGKHDRFEKRKKRRNALSRATTATMAVVALATGITAVAGMSAAITAALATLLLMTTGVKLVLTDTERDRELHRLTDTWRRHRVAASLLLARSRGRRAKDAAEKVHHDTVELERRIEETRSDSLLLDPEPDPGPITPPPPGRND